MNVKPLKENKELILILLVIGIAFLGFFIRIQSVPNFKDKYLMALDPYPFYRYAQDVVGNGYVRPLDTMRYYPVGYVPMRELLMHTYFNAVLFSMLKVFGWKLITVFIWYPAIATLLGIVAFYFLGKEVFNRKVGLITAALLATVPGFIFRTTVGYADKEPLAFFLFPLALLFLTKAFKTKDKRGYVWSLLSGVTLGALLLNWRGAIFIIASLAGLIAVLNLLGKIDKETWLKLSSLLIMIPIAMVGSTSYSLHSTTSDLMFQTFLGAYAIYTASFFLRYKFSSKFEPLIKKYKYEGLIYFAISAILLLLVASIVNFSLMSSLIKSLVYRITSPMGGSRLATSVSENQRPSLKSWWSSLNLVFVLAIIGSGLLINKILKDVNKKLVWVGWIVALLLFLSLVMSQYYIIPLALAGAIILFVYFDSYSEFTKKKLKEPELLILIWFIISLIAGRGAIRLIWQAIMPFSILCAYAIVRTSDIIIEETKKREIKDKVYYLLPYVLIIILIAVFANTSYKQRYGPYQELQWDQVTPWIQANTPKDAVFTHWWDYGYWVQALWNRTTVFDGGNAMARWNNINARFIMTGTNETQWMNALNYYHRPDYLVIVDDDILKFYQMARIGYRDYAPGKSIYYSLYGLAQKTRNQVTNASEYPDMLVFNGQPGVITKDLEIKGVFWPKEYTLLAQILVPTSENKTGEPIGVLYNTKLKTYDFLPFNCVCVQGKGCYDIREDGIPGCYMFLPSVDYGYNVRSPPGIIFIPDMAKDMLFTKLFIVDEEVPHFEKVYDNGVPLSYLSIQHGGITTLRIWKINYDNYTYIVDPCDVKKGCGEFDMLRGVLG